jgi:hypothetical protein
MAKRYQVRSAAASRRTAAPQGRAKRDIVHSSIYVSAAVHEALRHVAFEERCKIHDLIIEGIEAALHKRGYAPVDRNRADKKHK